MFGSDISMKHSINECRIRDFLAESEQQRQVDLALAARPRRSSLNLNDVRAAVASQLIRAGSWLMPEDAPDRVCQPSA